MQSFINNITNFISLIYNAIRSSINLQLGQSTLQLYDDWLNKNILSGDLINMSLTWRELLLFISTWF